MAESPDAAKIPPAPAGKATPYVGSGAVGTSKAAASAGVAAVGPEDNVVNQQVIVRLVERLGYRVDLVAKELDPNDVLLGGGLELERVATDAKSGAAQGLVVALVLEIDEVAQDGVTPGTIAYTNNLLFLLNCFKVLAGFTPTF